MFPRLFEPGCIGGVNLKNRVIKAPQHTGLANPDGSVTGRMLRYYKEVAQGGVGDHLSLEPFMGDCGLGRARSFNRPQGAPA